MQTYKEVLELKIEGGISIKEYLKDLLITLWREGEGFSGKRPLGYSDWEYDLYIPLLKAGLVEGALDEDGFVEEVDTRMADIIIEECIREVFDG